MAPIRCLLQTAIIASIPLACTGADKAAQPAAHSLIERFDTIIDPTTSSIGDISDLAVASNGTLWIADRSNRQIVSIAADGGGQQTFGGRGSGPGEMLRPEAICVTDSMILVVDPGNSRVQFHRPDGTPVGQFVVSRFLMVPMSLNSRGDIIVPTIGLDSSLAAILTDSARTTTVIGTPVVPPPAGMNLRGLREQALRGEIPVEFRNHVLPVVGDAGNSWLVLQTEGMVQAFDAGGRMKWSVALPDSIVGAARRDYLNRASAETNPTRVQLPRVVSGARVYGQQLWLMLSDSENGKNKLLVLDSDTGQLKRSIGLNLRGAGVFAVDSRRNRVYVVIPGEGLMVAGKLVASTAVFD